jgi:hypothetical protein
MIWYSRKLTNITVNNNKVNRIRVEMLSRTLARCVREDGKPTNFFFFLNPENPRFQEKSLKMVSRGDSAVIYCLSWTVLGAFVTVLEYASDTIPGADSVDFNLAARSGLFWPSLDSSKCKGEFTNLGHVTPTRRGPVGAACQIQTSNGFGLGRERTNS